MSIVKLKFLGIHLVVGLIIVSSVGWAATSSTPQKENPAIRLSSMEQEIKDLKTENTIQEKTLQSVDKFQQQIISERQNHQQFVEGMFSTFTYRISSEVWSDGSGAVRSKYLCRRQPMSSHT